MTSLVAREQAPPLEGESVWQPVAVGKALSIGTVWSKQTRGPCQEIHLDPLAIQPSGPFRWRGPV
jgi:hypothetical protein